MFQKSNLFNLCLFGIFSLIFTACTPESLDTIQKTETIELTSLENKPLQALDHWKKIEQQYADGYNVIVEDLEGKQYINPSKELVEEIYSFSSTSSNSFTFKFTDSSSTNGDCRMSFKVEGETTTWQSAFPIVGNDCGGIWVYNSPSTSDMCFTIKVTFDAGEEDPLGNETGEIDWEWQFNSIPSTTGTEIENGPRIEDEVVYAPCYG